MAAKVPNGLSSVGSGFALVGKETGGFLKGMMSPFVSFGSVGAAALGGAAAATGAMAARGLFASIGRFFKWLYRTIFPDNIYGFVLFYYFIVQYLFIDILMFNGNYGAPFVQQAYAFSAIAFTILITLEGTKEGGGFKFLLGRLLSTTIIFTFLYFATFNWIPRLMGSLGAGGVSSLNDLVNNSLGMTPVFPVVPIFAIFLIPIFYNKTRLGRSYVGWIIFLLILLNLSTIVDYIQTTIKKSTVDGSAAIQKGMVEQLWDSLTDNVAFAWNGFKALLNGSWMDSLYGDINEKVEGEYNEEAERMAISLSYPVAASSRMIRYDNGEVENDIFTTIGFAQRVSEECLVYGLCNVNGYVNVNCISNKIGVEVFDPEEKEWGMVSSSLLDVAELRLSPQLYQCRIRVTDEAVEGMISVTIKIDYDYTGTSNFDLILADSQMVASCAASGLNILSCLGYESVSLFSEGSSGPVLLSLGLPSNLQGLVITLKGSEEKRVPLLISISNEFEGKINRINSLYLAFPSGVTPKEGGLCRFDGEVDCSKIFGDGMSDYSCYSFDSDFLNNDEVMKTLEETSIACNLQIDNEALEGGKALKNIKAYLNYSYEVSKDIELEYISNVIYDDFEEEQAE